MQVEHIEQALAFRRFGLMHLLQEVGQEVAVVGVGRALQPHEAVAKP